MIESKASLMFIAGEASGDSHAARVIQEIARSCPQAHCFGAGGPKMRDAGMELCLDLTEHAVLGLVEVLGNYFKFRRFFHQMLDLVAERKPDAVVLVDYPGFNLRFAKALRRRFAAGRYRPKVVYYISPQVWAWAERRVRVIERCVNLVMSIFPFEKDWYAKRAPRLRVEFVGHPLLDQISPPPATEHPAQDVPTIALLPGSRQQEVRAHWPIMRAAAATILKRAPAKMVVLAASDSIQKLLAELGTGGYDVSRNVRETLAGSTFAIAASGTATLECAFYRVPTVVVYKVAWPTYCLGRLLVKVNHLAMPNLLAGGTVFPEFIQHRARPGLIADEILAWISDATKAQEVRDRLSQIIAGLGSPGASRRAAELILSDL